MQSTDTISFVKDSIPAAESRPRLLVVDDQKDFIETMFEIFHRDYEVFAAKSGLEAMKICRSTLPDLILLDVLMPGIGGLQVCRLLKSEPELSDIPVIIVTAQENPEDETKGLEAGAVDFITKPVNPAAVRARVHNHLTLKSQADLLRNTNEEMKVKNLHLLEVQSALTEKVAALEAAINKVRQLEGIIPICMHCKKIRNDNDYWQQIDQYITEHSAALFSEGICPDCMQEHYVTAADPDNEKYLLGRQPILNRSEELVAYELLFRSTGSLTADVTNASHATANVIINTMVGFGIEDILGDHKGFINLELELLMDDSLSILPKDQIVIELLETLKVTPELIERCRFLKENGFSLALDDHEYSPVFHELYQIVDIVKVDLMQSPPARLAEMVKQFGRYPLQLLAEKVETQEEFKQCLDLGFQLFQGYYFAKPSIMGKKKMNDSGSTLLKLMRLLSEDADQQEIEKCFRGDPGLTYKLLLLVNSVGAGVRNKIDSVRHAIAILGRQQIKRWIQLALFASGEQGGMENPLVDLAAVRAVFMENMVGSNSSLSEYHDSADKAFMTGILSVLEKVYDITIDEVVRKLNLSDDVRDALVLRGGRLGKLLLIAEYLEEMDYSRLGQLLDDLGISFEDVLTSQKGAFAWRKRMG